LAEELILKVAEALQSDVGHGRARIDTSTRVALNLEPGDIIEVKGKNITAAKVFRVNQDDEGFGIIRIDGLVRKNAGVSIGDKVVIKKAEMQPASSVTISPLISETHRIRFGPGIENFVKRGLLKRPLTKGDTIIVPGIALMGGSLPFVVANTKPKGIIEITEDTEMIVKEEAVKEGEIEISAVTYEDIGGLKEELQRVRETIELPLKHPELFDRLGIDPPKGVLLYGPPGTGKTLIAKAVSNEAGANFYSIQGPEIMSKYYGESEERLRQKFEEAEKNPPSVIFIDELDSIAPKREEVTGEVERRVVAQLLTLMDGLKARGNLIVIGATNREAAVDPALRRPGRFDREIEIGVPDRNGRKEILQIHTRGMPLAKDVSLGKLAEITHGFVGADLEALAREAAMSALRKILPEIDFELSDIPYEALLELEITMDNFLEAMKEIEPSAIREVFVEVPDVRWTDIGGLDNIKQELKEAIEWPLKYPDVFKKAGTNPPKGIMLYGKPGTGKTLLAKAVANESGVNFISIKGPQLISRYVGESERGVRETFRKAKHAAPTILFLDEIDSLVPKRGSSSTNSHVTERVISQFLAEMDGIEELKGVVVLAATNRLDLVDPAILRSGRFDLLFELPVPDEKTREEIFKIHTKNKPLNGTVDLKKLAKEIEGRTGSDIEFVCRKASMFAVREYIERNSTKKKISADGDLKVSKQHFDEAIKMLKEQNSK